MHRPLIAVIALASVHAATPPSSGAAEAWAEGTAWEGRTEWAAVQLAACRASAPRVENGPCRRFVGRALHRVHGIDDFRVGEADLPPNETARFVYRNPSLWQGLGAATDQVALAKAQELANDGRAVLALSTRGDTAHLVLVLPGSLSRSGSWAMDLPNSASFFDHRPARSYVGRKLSYAFRREDAADVQLFVRRR